MAGGTALLMEVSCCSVKPRDRLSARREASMVSSGDAALPVGFRIVPEREGRRHHVHQTAYHAKTPSSARHRRLNKLQTGFTRRPKVVRRHKANPTWDLTPCTRGFTTLTTTG